MHCFFHILFATFFAFGICFAEEDTPLQDIASSSSTPGNYDKPYSLNPIPINPNAPQPATWRQAYNKLCHSLEAMEEKVHELEERVAILEDSLDMPPNQ